MTLRLLPALTLATAAVALPLAAVPAAASSPDVVISRVYGGGNSGGSTPLTGTIAAGHHFLVQEAAGSAGTASLLTPYVTGTLNPSGTNGEVSLETARTAAPSPGAHEGTAALTPAAATPPASLPEAPLAAELVLLALPLGGALLLRLRKRSRS